jgi:hypothetical protein
VDGFENRFVEVLTLRALSRAKDNNALKDFFGPRVKTVKFRSRSFQKLVINDVLLILFSDQVPAFFEVTVDSRQSQQITFDVFGQLSSLLLVKRLGH